MGRDAPVTSSSPAQNFLNPPVVPDSFTVTDAMPCFVASSDTILETRNTVLEPSTRTDLLRRRSRGFLLLAAGSGDQEQAEASKARRSS
jgi:hypothetical protein